MNDDVSDIVGVSGVSLFLVDIASPRASN